MHRRGLLLIVAGLAAMLAAGCSSDSDAGDGGAEGPGEVNGDSAGVGDDDSCSPPTSDPDAPVSSDDPPPCPTAPINEDDYVFGEMMVESVEVLFLESFPVQVMASATGYLSDGCTEVHDTSVETNGNAIEITITTRRPKEAICTQALVGHTENVSLGALEPGNYDLVVNGVSTTFSAT